MTISLLNQYSHLIKYIFFKCKSGARKNRDLKKKTNKMMCPALANAYRFKVSQFQRPVVDI